MQFSNHSHQISTNVFLLLAFDQKCFSVQCSRVLCVWHQVFSLWFVRLLGIAHTYAWCNHSAVQHIYKFFFIRLHAIALYVLCVSVWAVLSCLTFDLFALMTYYTLLSIICFSFDLRQLLFGSLLSAFWMWCDDVIVAAIRRNVIDTTISFCTALYTLAALNMYQKHSRNALHIKNLTECK